MSGKRHVILGAGTAGINAIRTLRQLGEQGDIILVSAEKPYSRMALPYYLDQTISESHTHTATPQILEGWRVECRFGRRAVSLDAKGNKLKLDNENEIAYDNLLIATGSSPVRPSFPGSEDQSHFTFWNLADARGVIQRTRSKGLTVIIGTGFIAFTMLDGLIGRSEKVTVVESAPQILPRMLDETGAEMVAENLRTAGVELITGATITGIAEVPPASHQLTLADGKTLTANLVIMATGVRPNIDWLEGSGIECNQGILVNDHLRSNVANVYAAGDAAEGNNLITGAKEVQAIEPTAMEQGRVAAANMAGQRVSYPGSLPMNILSVAGLNVACIGNWKDDQAEVITGHAPERSSYRKYLFQNDRMIGAILIGKNSETWAENDLGMIKGIIQTKTPLGPWKDFLRNHPFIINKPYLASGLVSTLLPKTLLGKPTLPPGE